MTDIARLSPADHADYLAHLMALDAQARAAMHGEGADDASLQAHALRLAAREAIVIGARRFGRLVGAVEVIPVVPRRIATVSAAVERSARDAGLGTRLVLAAIEAGREAGYAELWFDVRAENPGMGRILARVATAAEAMPPGRRYIVRLAPAGAEAGDPLSRAWRVLTGRAA